MAPRLLAQTVAAQPQLLSSCPQEPSIGRPIASLGGDSASPLNALTDAASLWQGALQPGAARGAVTGRVWLPALEAAAAGGRPGESLLRTAERSSTGNDDDFESAGPPVGRDVRQVFPPDEPLSLWDWKFHTTRNPLAATIGRSRAAAAVENRWEGRLTEEHDGWASPEAARDPRAPVLDLLWRPLGRSATPAASPSFPTGDGDIRPAAATESLSPVEDLLSAAAKLEQAGLNDRAAEIRELAADLEADLAQSIRRLERQVEALRRWERGAAVEELAP
jgi:hypothetical protein